MVQSLCLLELCLPAVDAHKSTGQGQEENVDPSGCPARTARVGERVRVGWGESEGGYVECSRV